MQNIPVVHTRNIVKSFIIRSFLSIIILSVICSSSVYFYQQYSFYNTIVDNIKFYVDKQFVHKEKDLKPLSKEIIKKEVESFMSKLNFIDIEIYDKNKTLFLSMQTKEEDDLKQIQENEKLFNIDFLSSDIMKYEFIRLDEKNYFIQIFYPIYKNNDLLGYLEGISKVDLKLVKQYEKIKYVSIFIAIISIVLFGAIIFPLIYFAYNQLNKNRMELLKSNLLTLSALGNAVALRDSDTNEHNYRVTIYSVKLAEKLNLDKESIRKLIKGAFLHDVGKIGISDNILLKNGKLSPNEFEKMKSHVSKGVELIKDNSWLNDGVDIILYHHEKYDGSGYPNKVKGEDIPLIARVFSVVDGFDALTSKRPYKEPFSYEKSIEIIKENSGIYFDGKIVESFLEISKKLYYDIKGKNSKELRQTLEQVVKKYFIKE